jgi:hypothetical protein
MANQKLQVARALKVFKSNDADIPFPNICASGVTDGMAPDALVDSTATFIADGVAVGDIVYNTTSSISATVVNVDSNTQLTLNAFIFLVPGESYIVYKGGANNGCVLYIGGTGDVEVTTAGGDRVTFVEMLTGQFVPVQVLKVWATGTSATDILALW